jgi:hypothetical protein
MKRSEPTARTLKRQDRSETKAFLLLLLAIVGVVALIQVLLFLTMTRLGHGNVTHLILGWRPPAIPAIIDART